MPRASGSCARPISWTSRSRYSRNGFQSVAKQSTVVRDARILDKLQWRIRVEGAPLESATLRFNRLPKDIAEGLKFGGTAAGSAAALKIGKGEGTIEGLPIAIEGRAPVAQMEVAM